MGAEWPCAAGFALFGGWRVDLDKNTMKTRKEQIWTSKIKVMSQKIVQSRDPCRTPINKFKEECSKAFNGSNLASP